MAKPTIIFSLTLKNEDNSVSLDKGGSYTAREESSSSKTTTLTTSSGLVDVGTIKTPRFFGFHHLGTTGTVLISTDGGSNFDQECGPGDNAAVRIRTADRTETQTVITVADVADNLNLKYFTLDGNSGTWAIWIDVDDSGSTEPAHGMDSSAKISSIVTNDDAATVALAIFTDLSADSAFLEDFNIAYDADVDDDFLTITDNFTGARTNIADTGSTGFTVATTVEGAVGRTVHAKASAGEIECLQSIMPG